MFYFYVTLIINNANPKNIVIRDIFMADAALQPSELHV